MVLYTTHCPKCAVLEKKLSAKGLTYDVCEDVALMQKKGYTFVPVLEIDGKAYNFSEAVTYINELE